MDGMRVGCCAGSWAGAVSRTPATASMVSVARGAGNRIEKRVEMDMERAW